MSKKQYQQTIGICTTCAEYVFNEGQTPSSASPDWDKEALINYLSDSDLTFLDSPEEDTYFSNSPCPTCGGLPGGRVDVAEWY